jgi:hypothetical protein
MIVGLLLVGLFTFISVGAAFFAKFGPIGLAYAFLLANVIVLVAGAISAIKN